MKNKVMLFISFLLFLVFFLFAYQITQTEVLEVDHFFIQHVVVNGRTEFLTPLFKLLTFFASVAGIILFTLLGLMIIKKKKEKLPFFLNVGGAVLFSQIVKILFQRERPLLIYRLVEESGFSFPSGHSMVGASFYVYLIYLIWKGKLSKGKKIAMTTILSSLILGIGFSRIYLGVHYASDVIAGLCLGIGYTLIFILLKEPSSKTPNKSLLHSFHYAGEGIISAFFLERNMKIHVFVMTLVILAGIYFHISLGEWMICIILFGIVISAEIMNTAIETTIDLVMPDIHPKAKFAKDLAAGAVLVLAIISVIIGVMIFLPKFLILM